MPDLFTSLQKHDPRHIHIVADLWGLELEANEPEAAAKELCVSLLDTDLLAEILEALNPEAQSALEALVAKNGRIPWAEFTRRFGDIREMGPGKRDREKPHLNPASTAEILFYRALIARAFFNTASGAQEFAFIPDDLLTLMNRNPSRSGQEEREERNEEKDKNLASSLAPSTTDRVPRVDGARAPRVDGAHDASMPVRRSSRATKMLHEDGETGAANLAVQSEPLGRPASPVEKAHPLPANDHLLDDSTTLLAALRLGIEAPETQVPTQVIEQLLKSAKIILKSGPKPEKVKVFLEASRNEASQMLTDAWLESESFNELRQVPGLTFEGEWKNQPLVTREFLLNLLDSIPEGKWWSLIAFIRDVKTKYPDFQRPAGDYDSWFIKRAMDGEYLRGFAFWDQVDGALIKYFITGILFWLGQVELAAPEAGAEPTAFRVKSENAKVISEEEKLVARSNGQVAVPRFAPRAVRYQIARFCEWGEARAGEYRFIITPSSLKKAGEQGLKVEHLLTLLAKHASGGIPPVLVKALKRWEANGIEARVQTQAILRVSRPGILEELRKSKAARFLGEILGPTAVVVKDGAQSKVLAALAELGLLAEEETGTKK